MDSSDCWVLKNLKKIDKKFFKQYKKIIWMLDLDLNSKHLLLERYRKRLKQPNRKNFFNWYYQGVRTMKREKAMGAHKCMGKKPCKYAFIMRQFGLTYNACNHPDSFYDWELNPVKCEMYVPKRKINYKQFEKMDKFLKVN